MSDTETQDQDSTQVNRVKIHSFVAHYPLHSLADLPISRHIDPTAWEELSHPAITARNQTFRPLSIGRHSSIIQLRELVRRGDAHA